MIRKILSEYTPLNNQERIEVESMIHFIDKNEDYLLRSNMVGHFTGSAIIVNNTYDKVLFIHHNLYNAWGWTGGHNDGDEDIKFVAIKEAKEETGLTNFEIHEDVLGIDTIYVKNHVRKGDYVPDHLHFNITYLVVADESHQTEVKLDENSGVKWFDIDTVLDYVDEPRMIPVYSKLFRNIKNVKKSKKERV